MAWTGIALDLEEDEEDAVWLAAEEDVAWPAGVGVAGKVTVKNPAAVVKVVVTSPRMTRLVKSNVWTHIAEEPDSVHDSPMECPTLSEALKLTSEAFPTRVSVF
jgi:hypothetical protein